MIGMSILCLLLGIIISGICGVLPNSFLFYIPEYFRMMMFAVGAVIAFAGFILLLIRAKKTGAIHLITPARPGHVLWLYVYADGTAELTPAIRSGESQLYSEKLDSQVFDVKSYRLADHNFRIVSEVIGQAVDLDYVLYADLLKSKFGFKNLREARKSVFDSLLNKVGIKRNKIIPSDEHVQVRRDS